MSRDLPTSCVVLLGVERLLCDCDPTEPTQTDPGDMGRLGWSNSKRRRCPLEVCIVSGISGQVKQGLRGRRRL